MHAVRLEYTNCPRLLPLYVRALLGRRSGLKQKQTLPLIRSEWRDFNMNSEHLKRFTHACRLAPSDTMPLVYPLVFAFPLHVTIVCHDRFPLLYVRMMQIRNHVIQHRPIGVHETLDITCAIVGHRIAAMGLEMDVYTVLETTDGAVWESIHTYFFPGNFGMAGQPSPLSELPILPDKSVEKTWKMPNGGGFCFGLMTGDYNAIHYLAPYARYMGFQRDFAHAQLTLGLCLRYLPPFHENETVSLDVALKGPVYYGSNVTTRIIRRANKETYVLPLNCMIW